MSYSKHFFDDTKPLHKPKIVCVEDDWEFLCDVFPEPGFRSYFCGHIISKLATELKQHGVNSYFERTGWPELTDLPRFLSNLTFIGQARQSDDGRRIGSPCYETPYGEGVPTGHAILAVRETKEGKVIVRELGKAGPEAVGLIEQALSPNLIKP